MKKTFVMLIISSLLLCGCAGNSGSGAAASVSETAVNTETGGTKAADPGSKVQESKDGGEDDPSAGKEASSEVVNDHTLYEDYLKNNCPAVFSDKGTSFSQINANALFEEGKPYTLGEMIKGCADAIRETMSSGEEEVVPEAMYAYIDCGGDGADELLINVGYPTTSEYWLHNYIIKNIGGELKLCYASDSWSRSRVSVNDRGYITGDGSSGAANVNLDFSFVDGNGDWHFLYGEDDNYYPLTLYADGELKEMADMGLDVDNTMFMEYYFDPEWSEDRPVYCTFAAFSMLSSSGDGKPDTSPALYEASSDRMKAFDKAGIKIYPYEEIMDMIEEREKETGFDKALYHAEEGDDAWPEMKELDLGPMNVTSGAASSSKVIPDEAEMIRLYAETVAVKLMGNPLSCGYGLIHIDSDMIPELVLTTGDSHPDAVSVYTLSGGEVIECGSYGQMGSFIYTPYDGIIQSYYSGMGEMMTTYYRLDGGSVAELDSSEERFGDYLFRHFSLEQMTPYVEGDSVEDIANSLGYWLEETGEVFVSARDDLIGNTDAGSVPDLRSHDFGEEVVFIAANDVTDFKINSLSYELDEENAKMLYSVTETLYRQDILAKGTPLTVQLSFPYDVPTNGISFVDSTGVTRTYCIIESMRDGTLGLLTYEE